MNKKFLIITLIALLLLTSALSGCSQSMATTEESLDASDDASSSSETSTVDIASSDAIPEASPADYESSDLDSVYNETDVTKILLQDDSTSIVGEGAVFEDNIVTINKAGTYVLSGTLTDGQLLVDASKEDVVQLVLDNVQITNLSGTAILLNQSDKTIVTLAQGTTNIITDGLSYALAGDEDPDAAIYARDDLTINGLGALQVNGNYMHAIKTTDDLIIAEGQLTITSVADGLRGKDSVSIAGGEIVIEAGGDGIQSNNNEETDQGWISIDGGSFSIIAAEAGIQAESALHISGGNITIKSVGDALHSNGTIQVDDGQLLLTTDDDAAHADDSLLVTGGTLIIPACYEGLEGSNVTILGGTISITSDDDGINSAGGNDSTAEVKELRGTASTESEPVNAPMPPADTFNEGGDYFIAIHGGSIYIDAFGDGLDSNGTIEITGGTLVVAGEADGPDAAIDCDTKSFTITGGTLVASGSTKMLSLPTQATQAVFTIISDSILESAQQITLVDSEGNNLLSFKAAKDFQYIMISSPQLVQGETYTIKYGGEYTGQVLEGTLYSNGTLTGASSEATFVLDQVIMTLSPDGTVVEYTAQMGGNKGGGPMATDIRDGQMPQDRTH